MLSLLVAHAEAVRAANPRLGLVAAGDEGDLIPRHTADSMLFALARTPAADERWVDVGSGAGFPGIVLACCFPECSFTLLEPQGRRAGFLELVTSDLGLANVVVDGRRLESLGDGGFDVAVARAFSDPNKALRALAVAVRPGGEVVVALGAQVQIDPPARIVEVQVPDDVDSPGLFSMMSREA